MTQPVLLDFFREMPERLPNEKSRLWRQRLHEGLENYRTAVLGRYSENTLERLLGRSDSESRQAAVTALSLVGSMRVNRSLARLLHDEDSTVRKLTEEALWSLWFRAGTVEQNQELQTLAGMDLKKEGPEAILAGFDALIQKAPQFAEVYNQRAMFFFRMGNWDRAIADCTMVLRLNHFHFGAASGLAQCYLKQKKFRASLRAYRRAFRINPNLEGVEQVIQSLEKKLGEEGRK